MIYDCLIIGAGPGGIKSAVALKEAGYQVAILEFSMPGGKANIAPRVDNYPGFKEISGPDLAMEFYNEMISNNIEFLPRKVLEIKKENNLFKLITDGDEYISKSVIVATGTDEEKLNLENEKEVFGHGLSYCAICDGHFFRNRITVVVAEDKYALSEAIYLAKLAKEVIVITSKKELVGNNKLKDELASFPNVRYIHERKITKLISNPLKQIELDDGSLIDVDGLFPLLGYIPNTSFIKNKELLDEDGFIKVNEKQETSIPGLFAIGDVTSRELKQIYLAVLDASRAVKAIKEYLDE